LYPTVARFTTAFSGTGDRYDLRRARECARGPAPRGAPPPQYCWRIRAFKPGPRGPAGVRISIRETGCAAARHAEFFRTLAGLRRLSANSPAVSSPPALAGAAPPRRTDLRLPLR